jgi:SPP1 family predicted phage head-tail adaptor
MDGAGALRERVSFDRREDLSGDSPPGDAYGNVEGNWQEQFTVAARIIPRLGGEEVMAARLAGRQPYTIRVRSSSDTRRISTDWRARNARDGIVYNIRAVSNVDERNVFLDLLCEAGVAV